jgi:DNA polymerase-4
VSVKIRFADFRTLTRSRTLDEPTDVAHEIYAAAAGLHDALGLGRARLRLVGVRLEGLVDTGAHARQLALDAPELGWREAEQAVDRVAARFGPDVVRKARLVDPSGDPD